MSDPQPDRRFSDDDFSVILRKAAEMQEASGAPQHAEGLTLAEIEHIAREAGIDPRYVRRAANSLTATPPSEWGARLLGGPRRFHLADEVPGRIPDQGWKKLVEEVRRDFAKDDKVAHLPGSLEWKGKSGTGLELDMWVTSDDEGTRLSLRGDAEEEMMVWHLLGPMGGVLASILIIGGLDAAGVEAVLLGLGGATGGYGFARAMWRRRAAQWRQRLGGQMERLTRTAADVAEPPAAELPPASQR